VLQLKDGESERDLQRAKGLPAQLDGEVACHLNFSTRYRNGFGGETMSEAE
jgi:hypothetical protein